MFLVYGPRKFRTRATRQLQSVSFIQSVTYLLTYSMEQSPS